jgi:deoxyinosine 3'endonuclease (endonuclease V)
MTMTTLMMSRTIQRGSVVRGADVSFDEHERLAFAMLAVEADDVADVEDAMRKIITSAPVATDVALVLLLAISHAEDRALRC